MERSRLREGGALNETSTGFPVLACLDETASLKSMPILQDAAAQLAGFGLQMLLVFQDLSQPQELYEKRWESFIANAGVFQCFSNTDMATLKYISELLGTTSVLAENKQSQTLEAMTHGSMGQSFNIQTSPLLTTNEISQIFRRDDPQRRQLILRAGRKPLIINRFRYWDSSLPEHQFFRRKIQELEMNYYA